MRAPGSKVTVALRTRAGSGASNNGSMRTAPVKYSAGPFPEGREPLRLISMGPPFDFSGFILRDARNGALLRIRSYPHGEERGNTARLEPCGHGWTIMTWFSRDTSSYYCWEKEPMPGVSGIGGRGTDNSCACGCAAACGGGSACGDVGAAAARGGGGGIGLRAGAAAGRGRGAAILGRGCDPGRAGFLGPGMKVVLRTSDRSRSPGFREPRGGPTMEDGRAMARRRVCGR